MAAVYQNFVKTKVLFSCCEQRSVAAAAFISLIYNQVVASSGLATACTLQKLGPRTYRMSQLFVAIARCSVACVYCVVYIANKFLSSITGNKL